MVNINPLRPQTYNISPWPQFLFPRHAYAHVGLTWVECELGGIQVGMDTGGGLFTVFAFSGTHLGMTTLPTHPTLIWHGSHLGPMQCSVQPRWGWCLTPPGPIADFDGLITGTQIWDQHGTHGQNLLVSSWATHTDPTWACYLSLCLPKAWHVCFYA